MRRLLAMLASVAVCVALEGVAVRASDPPPAAHPPATPVAAPAPTPVEPTAATPAPRRGSAKHVDEVMDRVRKLVAAYQKEVPPEAGTPAARSEHVAPTPAKSTRPPTTTPRVALVWRATLVWPSELVEADASDRWD